jgi:hypothetical protein
VQLHKALDERQADTQVDTQAALETVRRSLPGRIPAAPFLTQRIAAQHYAKIHLQVDRT